jgi:tetratricopeptide (TPR) repeat protein
MYIMLFTSVIKQVSVWTILLLLQASSAAPALAQNTVQRIMQRQCPLRWPVNQTDEATIQDFQQQLKAAQRSGNSPLAAGLLNALGDIYRVTGHYNASLEAFQQSISLAKTIADPGIESASLGGISHTYVELGQYDQAAVASERSLQLRLVSNRETLALNNFGVITALQGRFTAAMGHYKAGLALVKNEDLKRHSVQWIKGNQGNTTYMTQGAASAIAAYAQVKINASDPSNYGALLNNQALAHQALGQSNQALQRYNQALTYFVPTVETSCHWKTLSNRGRSLVTQGKSAEAILSYQQAVAITTAIWQDSMTPLSPNQQKSYLQVIWPIYEELAGLLIEQGRLTEAETLLNTLTPGAASR